MTQLVNNRALTRTELARLVAEQIPADSFVNLGIGLPTLVADHLPPGNRVVLHTENGMLGMGPTATDEQFDPDLTNAGKIPVTELAGASYFHQADSFAMIRGGHVDLCVLGAFQVSQHGDLANWDTGDGAIPAVGGAMDLAVGAKRVFAMMTLFTRSGDPKLVPECSLLLTAPSVVNRLYTDYGVFDLTGDGISVEAAFGASVDELAERLQLELRDVSAR